jgi:transposase
MNVMAHAPADLDDLRKRVAREGHAKRRDRFRVVLEALRGQQTLDIARLVGRSRKFVQHWVYQYRDHGLAGLEGKSYPGRKPKLTAEQEDKLKARLDAGAQDQDGVCALRGQDIRRIIQQEFGVVYAKNAVYDLLKRLDYSSLKPRPRHPKNDPVAMEQFKASAPLLSRR